MHGFTLLNHTGGVALVCPVCSGNGTNTGKKKLPVRRKAPRDRQF